MTWYDQDRYSLEQFAARTIDDAKNESAEAIMAVIAARTSIYLRDLVDEISYFRSDLTGIKDAITNAAATQISVATPYQPPSVDAQDVQNLTKAITTLEKTIFEMSPEQRGIHYTVDELVKVPE